jgi:hypothetical protein
MSTYNPTASVSGFSEGQAPSYEKIPLKPKTQYQKVKGFPPARKKVNGTDTSQRLMRPTTLPQTPPDYPMAALL